MAWAVRIQPMTTPLRTHSSASEAGLASLMAKLEARDVLSDDEKAGLAEAGSINKTYRAGEHLVREGDRQKESILLLTGMSARYNDLEDGRRQITALQIAGDFVDLHSLLLHKMDHGIVALTDCTVRLFPHEALRAITERFPHLTRLLWLSTLIDSAIHRRWLVAMGRLPSTAHLAHLLCEVATRLRVVGLVEADSFDFPLTQTNLADMMGLSIVHVNRVVQELRSMGLIAWAQRRLTILDWPRLRALAEFNPDYLHLEREPR